ncbi:MAG: rhodanese-like domain-containing protein [Candidatus Odinarchaeota archaeon]
MDKLNTKRDYKGVSKMGFYLKAMFKYWKKTLRLFVNLTLHGMEWSGWPEITVDELLERINSNKPPLIIDIRSTREFSRDHGHIPNARSIPIFELKATLEDLQSFKEKEIVTICPGGGLSVVAVDILVEAGFKKVKSLKGGLNLWCQRGYPTTTS